MSAPVATPAPQSLDHPLSGRAISTSATISALFTHLFRYWPLFLIAVVALASRARYVWDHHDAYGSGDANLVLTRALLIERGEFAPPGSLGAVAGLFSTPPLIPLLFAAVVKATPLSLHSVPLVLGPLLTIAGLCALYFVVTRAFDRTVALLACLGVALLPRFAFDSTEPDKVAYVVAFFVIALYFLYEGQRRPWMFLLAGLFMGFALFAHNAALLFLPAYVGSHIALSRGSLRRTLSPYFLASCVIAAAFFASYVALDRRYEPSTPPVVAVAGASAQSVPDSGAVLPPDSTPSDALAPEGESSSLLPGPVRAYWLNVRTLARHGFRDSAWDPYFDGIRGQLLDPVFVLAVGGFAVGVWLAIARRRLEVVPLLLWMSVVTVGFAIQHPAASHTSRYPSYVTPVFVVMAVFFAVWAARQITSRAGWQPSYALVLAAPVLAWVAFSYATAPKEGARQLYEGHAQLAEYVNQQQLLDEDARLLYLGWPSYTYTLLEGGADEGNLQTFGWLPMAVDRYDFAGSHIKYYAYDDYSDDYYGTAARMMDAIRLNYDVRELASFCTVPSVANGRQACAGHVRLFELVSKKNAVR